MEVSDNSDYLETSLGNQFIDQIISFYKVEFLKISKIKQLKRAKKNQDV